MNSGSWKDTRCCYNDPGVTAKSMEFARNYLGSDNVEELGIRMTAEDFAFFAQQYPAVLYRLGVRKSEQARVPRTAYTTF